MAATTGHHTLVLSGDAADYGIALIGNTVTYTVQDKRAGSPDGTEMVAGFDTIHFADQTLPFETTDGYTLLKAFSNVLRTDLAASVGPAFAQEKSLLEPATETLAQALTHVPSAADSTTAVAAMSYQFFTGSAPTPAGLDYLVSPTGGNPDNLNSAYYSQFSTTNRYINFASNLGKLGAGAAAFQASYGGLSLINATTKAYAAIFGSTPTADKVGHLLNDLVPDGVAGTYARSNYFALYGGDGIDGIGTKAAMVGWLIAQADSAHIGTLATADTAYLLDLAAGKITGSVDLVGTCHGAPYIGG